MRPIGPVLSCGLALLWAASAQGRDITTRDFIRDGGGPPYRIVAPKAPQPPRVDGRLDDACWDGLKPVGPWFIANTSRPAEQQMTAFVTFTDDALFIAVAAEDRDMIGGASGRDADEVWQTDCVEVFLSPQRSRNPDEWYQFIANLAGARYDGTLGKQGRNWNPEPDWEAAGQQHPWGWTVEVKLPFAALVKAPPARGDVWAIRLARENYGRKTPTELSSWTLTGFGFDDVVNVGELIFEQIDNAKLAAAHRVKEGVLCLTGNAPPGLEHLNRDVGGRYSYFEAGTDAFHFPYYIPFENRNVAEGMRVGGWLPFAEGLLTDGRVGPAAGWPVFHIGDNGFDIVFDLGMEYLIDRVEVLAGSRVIRNVSLYLKSPGGRYVMTRALHDLAEFNAKGYEKHALAEFDDVSAGARWVRLNATFSDGPYPGLSEVRIWGRPLKPAEVPAKVALRQNKGQVMVDAPNEIALPSAPDPLIFPLPQEIERGQGFFALEPTVEIGTPEDASPRLKTTAETFRDELKLSFGIESAVSATQAAAITLREEKGVTPRPEGYRLIVKESGVQVIGQDPAGLFHGCMSLLQAVQWREGRWVVPRMTVRDWPEKPYRYIVANRRLTPGLVRALARMKFNHFNNLCATTLSAAREFDKYVQGIAATADRYFVKIAPMVQFNSAWLPDPQRFVERMPGESLDKLGTGRRNPCPSDPDLWKTYFEALNAAIEHCSSEFVNVNLDEMGQLANGSRWNVCDRCRGRNLSGHLLWVETLKKIDAHLAARGKQVIMNDSPFWQKGISHPDDRENDWRLAADILSREGLARRFAVYVWHPKDVTERLAKLGFPLLRWRNRVPTAEDAQKPYDGYYLNLSDGPFDLAIATGAAQMAWSPARLSPDSAEFDAVMEAFQPVVSQLADNVALPSRRPGEKEFFTVDLSAAANEGRRDDDPSDGKGWVDLGREMDLRALRPGRRTFVGVPFDILDEDANAGKGCVIVHNPARVDRTLPMRVEVPVDRHAASLLFLHALTERPGQNYNRRAELAGFYLMVYEDGTFDKEDIKYNVNAANWDGLPTKWAYSPQGKTMKRGMLAWEGKTLAGATAALYVAEWVNPRPDKKIVRLIVSAPRLKRAASPILLAVTGVSPSGSDRPAAGRGWPVSLLASAPPQGRAIDLTGGRIVSDQAYVAPDGTTVRAEGLLNRVNVVGCDDYWTAGACVLYDNNQSARTATGAQPVVFAFPEPRRLAGVSVTPSYRQEYDTRDFQGRMHSYAIEVSPDGVSWRALPQQTQHDPEVEGPRFVSLPEDPCKAVRLKGSFAFILFHER